MLTAEQIKKARDRSTQTVPCPEWGGDVLIGSMGALDRARILDWLEEQQQRPQPAKPEGDGEPDDGEITVMTTDSPGGEPEPLDGDEPGEANAAAPTPARNPYTNTQDAELMLRYVAASILDPVTFEPAFSVEDVEQLGAKTRTPLRRIYIAALELNGDTEASRKQLEKNSGSVSSPGEGTDESANGSGGD